MTHPLVQPLPEPEKTIEEADRVIEYRRQRMLSAGFTETQALALAVSTADIHRAEDLIAKGCQRRLVVAILC